MAEPAHPRHVPEPLVLQRDRHLKWKAFDRLELALMLLCGLLLSGFATTVFLDVVTRTLGHPWLWLQEVTSAQFIYCVFVGTAVAVRRNDHLLLTAITGAMKGRLRWQQARIASARSPFDVHTATISGFSSSSILR